MVGVVRKPDTEKKLRILSTDAQYDLACACSGGKDESPLFSQIHGFEGMLLAIIRISHQEHNSQLQVPSKTDLPFQAYIPDEIKGDIFVNGYIIRCAVTHDFYVLLGIPTDEEGS